MAQRRQFKHGDAERRAAPCFKPCLAPAHRALLETSEVERGSRYHPALRDVEWSRWRLIPKIAKAVILIEKLLVEKIVRRQSCDPESFGKAPSEGSINIKEIVPTIRLAQVIVTEQVRTTF